jgi:hypothetical protein
MTARRVPLYLGEGSDRQKIGEAEVDGNLVTCIIDDVTAREVFKSDVAEMWSLQLPMKFPGKEDHLGKVKYVNLRKEDDAPANPDHPSYG